jgi:hypothetical protein
MALHWWRLVWPSTSHRKSRKTSSIRSQACCCRNILHKCLHHQLPSRLQQPRPTLPRRCYRVRHHDTNLYVDTIELSPLPVYGPLPTNGSVDRCAVVIDTHRKLMGYILTTLRVRAVASFGYAWWLVAILPIPQEVSLQNSHSRPWKNSQPCKTSVSQPVFR